MLQFKPTFMRIRFQVFPTKQSKKWFVEMNFRFPFIHHDVSAFRLTIMSLHTMFLRIRTALGVCTKDMVFNLKSRKLEQLILKA